MRTSSIPHWLLTKLGNFRLYCYVLLWASVTFASYTNKLSLISYITINLFFLLLATEFLFNNEKSIGNIEKIVSNNEKSIDNIEKIVSNLEKKFSPRKTFFNLLRESDDLINDFKRAQSIWLLTKTGMGFFKNFGNSISEIPKKRFLFIKPERFDDYFRYIQIIWNQPNRARYEKFLKERICSQVNRGELRVTDFLSPWTLIIIDPDDNNSKIYVELGDYKSTNESRYAFVIEKSEDQELYEYFKKQFEKIWKEAQDWC
ncbi:hypothetical protein [Methanocaldococcus sp.]